jgi:hypothetical protein
MARQYRTLGSHEPKSDLDEVKSTGHVSWRLSFSNMMCRAGGLVGVSLIANG